MKTIFSVVAVFWLRRRRCLLPLPDYGLPWLSKRQIVLHAHAFLTFRAGAEGASDRAPQKGGRRSEATGGRAKRGGLYSYSHAAFRGFRTFLTGVISLSFFSSFLFSRGLSLVFFFQQSQAVVYFSQRKFTSLVRENSRHSQRKFTS